jgi:hypothetical protein
MKSARALSFALVALSFAPAGFPQLTSIWGTVRDSKGRPIDKAKITFTLENSSPLFLASKLTNDDGIFFVSQLQPGNYTYVVEAAGYSKSKEARVNLPTDVQGIEVVLEELPSSGDTITVRAGQIPLGREVGGMSVLGPPPPRLESYVVTLIPGASLTLLAERTRPSGARLSTDALLERFNRLCNDYRTDEQKADVRAAALVRTLKARDQVGPALEKRLKEFDSNNDRGLSNEEEKDEYPLEGNEIVKRKLNIELEAFSHYITTLRTLRETVAELALRHKFGLEEAADYSEFLRKHSRLFGSEADVPLAEGTPPDPAIFRHEKDVHNLLLALSTQPRTSKIAVLTGSGIALGFLEASPAEEKSQVAVPGNITMTRKFEPITRNIGNSGVVYRIDLYTKVNPPSGTRVRELSGEAQTIVSKGKMEPARWEFEVDADQSFGQLEMNIFAELQEYSDTGLIRDSQAIDVPVSHVRVVPSPTWADKQWAKFGRYFGSPATIVGVLIGALGMMGLHERIRKFFLSDMKTIGSLGSTKLGGVISVGREKFAGIIRALRRTRSK